MISIGIVLFFISFINIKSHLLCTLAVKQNTTTYLEQLHLRDAADKKSYSNLIEAKIMLDALPIATL